MALLNADLLIRSGACVQSSVASPVAQTVVPAELVLAATRWFSAVRELVRALQSLEACRRSKP